MHLTEFMRTRYPSLTKQDCAVMLANIEESLAVFRRKQVVLSASELQLKSLLSALREELMQHRVQLTNDLDL